MPNLPSQMIPHMLDWRQIWGSGRPRKGGNSVVTVLRHPCRVRMNIVLLKMAPRSRCMSGNTCGCRMSWTYHWAVMVPWINTRGDRVLWAMAHHTITPGVGAVCRCKAKAGLRRSP
ncbi:uncharacterized protein TNCV_2210961 [Trichonephila clavipes]|nr:uncharacterized protein TNCV_2210961 [Trichonephila clavipes]